MWDTCTSITTSSLKPASECSCNTTIEQGKGCITGNRKAKYICLFRKELQTQSSIFQIEKRRSFKFVIQHLSSTKPQMVLFPWTKWAERPFSRIGIVSIPMLVSATVCMHNTLQELHVKSKPETIAIPLHQFPVAAYLSAIGLPGQYLVIWQQSWCLQSMAVTCVILVSVTLSNQSMVSGQ